MSRCDTVRATLLSGDPLDASAAGHLHACADCGAEAVLIGALTQSLAATVAPPPGLAVRVQRAAAPLLAARARHASWRALARAVGMALLPLPAVVLVNVYLVRAAHAVLSTILPEALSLYLVVNYTALLALLLTLTYGAIPLLSERQLRLRREESHA